VRLFFRASRWGSQISIFRLKRIEDVQACRLKPNPQHRCKLAAVLPSQLTASESPHIIEHGVMPMTGAKEPVLRALPPAAQRLNPILDYALGD